MMIVKTWQMMAVFTTKILINNEFNLWKIYKMKKG